MEIPFFLFIATGIIGIYMAWNIGANDVSNSMASAVGARAITLKQAILIAAVLDFIGAVFIGSHVTDTVRKGIVDPLGIADPLSLALGTLSALLGAGIWVTIATWKSLPVSTTHSIVGALVGFGLVSGGKEVIKWNKVTHIVLSWIISPLFSCILAILIFRIIVVFILKKRSREALLKISPLLTGMTTFIVTLSLFLKTPLSQKLPLNPFTSSLGLTLIGSLLGFFWTKKLMKRKVGIEGIFRKLQIMTSCYVALAHGANDVANAVGPMATVYSVLRSGVVALKVTVPLWMLAVGGMGIALGVTTWGYRVISTLGSKITTLTNTRGFTIDFSTATSILISSKLGMPVSTTHAVVGAVVGVGLARGLEAVDLRVVRRILYSWFLTLPVSALSTILIYQGLFPIFRR